MSGNKEAAPFGAMTAAPEVQDSLARSGQEQEVKVILAAWRNMCSTLQQRGLCEDSAAPGPDRSFLTTQRKSTQARKVPSPRMRPR